MDLSLEEVRWDTVTWDYVRIWQGELPPQPKGALVRYRLGARIKGTDQWFFADNQSPQLNDATDFAIWIDHDQIPSWAHDSRIYHVFLDRFFPGKGREWEHPGDLSGFFGGTLLGVIQKLDYIQDLGFNALWLSPVFASPTHHGYDATDYYTVEPRLGTNEDMLELIADAHKREMRIILDFVANHWSNLHPTFQAAQKDKNCEFIDWYTWKKWPDEYKTYFDVKSMPELNLRPGSPARAYLLECAQYWLKKGVDGYRLDYAYGPPYDFWVDFRKACRQVNPNCFLFGEVVHTANKQKSYAGVFDGIIDFHLARALRETFAQNSWSLAEFEAFLSAHESYFGDTLLRVSILDNHDMNRFLFLAGNDTSKLKVAALVLMTLSQPVIL
jgi:glycosidase